MTRVRDRVAVTGMGVVSAIGCSTATFCESLLRGQSGVRRLQDDPAIVAAYADFVAEEHFSKLELMGMDRFAQFTLIAARQAIREARLGADELADARVGVYFGSGIGGAGALEAAYRAFLGGSGNGRVAPLSIVMTMANAGAAHVSLKFGIRGPCLTYCVACASAAVAIGEGYRAIRDGYLDVAIVGGAEALLTPGMIAAWKALRVLAPADAAHPECSCRPFAKGRGGMVLGEGAGMLVLESADHARARGQGVDVELAGYGVTSDAAHLSKPSAEGQARAMLAALQDADIAAADIDYINAHGTATSVGDAVETASIKQAFGPHAYHVPVTSTKALHGHTLGAGGAIELIATLLAMRSGTIPATQHYDARDDECDLDYVPNVSRTGVDIHAAMSNSFAFGGTNAVLVARAAR